MCANLLTFIHLYSHIYTFKLPCSFCVYFWFLQLDHALIFTMQLTAQQVSRIGAVIVLLGAKGVFLFLWGEGTKGIPVPPTKRGGMGF